MPAVGMHEVSFLTSLIVFENPSILKFFLHFSHIFFPLQLGHNLNLAHSGGLDGKTYTDHTCIMGNPLYSDHIGDMCFNPAKNYQIVKSGEDKPSNGNWYDEDRLQTWIPVVNNGWSGRLVGIADYGVLTWSGDDTSKIVLRIESGTTSNDFLYIGFNRATGINSDNQQGSNKVTIIESGNGLDYSQSYLKAILSRGQRYKVDNWMNTGQPLIVSVDAIQLNSSPAYASVRVWLGQEVISTPNPTTAQPTTANPTTAQPTTAQPTPNPTTANPTPNPTISAQVPFTLECNSSHSDNTANYNPADMPSCKTSTGSGGGRWYIITGSKFGQSVTLSTCNQASYDTKISVWGDMWNPGDTCIVGNDDACGVQSRVTYTSDGGIAFALVQ